MERTLLVCAFQLDCHMTKTIEIRCLVPCRLTPTNQVGSGEGGCGCPCGWPERRGRQIWIGQEMGPPNQHGNAKPWMQQKGCKTGSRLLAVRLGRMEREWGASVLEHNVGQHTASGVNLWQLFIWGSGTQERFCPPEEISESCLLYQGKENATTRRASSIENAYLRLSRKVLDAMPFL